MKKFKYKAVDAKDRVHEGIIEASNHEDFLAKIYKLRLFPIETSVLGHTDDKIERLRKLKEKLENHDKPLEPQITIEPEPKSKSRMDWEYISLVLLILTLVVLSSQVNF